MSDLNKAINYQTPRGFRMVPCTITTASPLMVVLATGGSMAGLSVPGLTYTDGSSGMALWTPPNQPLILPTGA